MKRRNFLKQHAGGTNPRYRNHAKKRKFRIPKKVFIFTISFVFLVVSLYGLYTWTATSDRFYIQEITISDLQIVPPDELWQTIHSFHSEHGLLYSKRHIWNQQNELLRERLLNSGQFIDVTIEQSGQTLNIECIERIDYVVVGSGGGWSKLYPSGELVEMSEDEKIAVGEVINTGEHNQDVFFHADTPILEFVRGVPQAGFMMSSDVIQKLLTVNDQLVTTNVRPIIYQIENPKDTWMRVRSELGTDILFETDSDLEKQLEVLNVVLEEYGADISSIEYIDVRFNDRAYRKE